MNKGKIYSSAKVLMLKGMSNTVSFFCRKETKNLQGAWPQIFFKIVESN